LAAAARRPIEPTLHPVHHRDELVARQSGAGDHRRELLCAASGGDRHMIVEGDRVDAARLEPFEHRGLGVEIVGLVPQVKPGVSGEPRPQLLECPQDGVRILRPAQARLPRPGDAVKHRGDAVGDRLPVAVAERDVERKTDARPRHHLPLEGVAVNVDDPGQDQQPRRVDPLLRRLIAAEGTDRTAL
jgi:hypothetical protein